MNLGEAEFDTPASVRRFTAAEFQELFDREILDDEPDKLELLDGVIYSAMAEGHPHRRTVNLLNRLMTTRFAEPYVVQIGMSLHLGIHDVPSPDLVVYRPGGDEYSAFVDLADVVLAIEVADSSLRKDRVLKQRRYALAGVREYWIVNVNGPEIDRYTEPRDGGYTSFRRYGADEAVVPSALPGEPVTPRDVVRR